MLRENNEDCPIETYAPPIAASAPEINTAVHRTPETPIPAVSAASGFSPTARSRRPNGVRYNRYQTAGTRAKPMTIGAFGIRLVWGIGGVAPVVPKSALLRSVGTPSIKMLIAVPATTWLASKRMQATARMHAMKMPLAIPARRPSHGLPA